MAWLAARWTGRETVAPAAWLTAGSPFLVWYSQECRNYEFVMLATTLSTASLLELQRRAGALGVARTVALSLAGALSNLSFALLLPFHLRLWLAAGETRPQRMRSLRIAAIVAVVAALPWLAAMGRIWDWSRLSRGSGRLLCSILSVSAAWLALGSGATGSAPFARCTSAPAITGNAPTMVAS